MKVVLIIIGSLAGLYTVAGLVQFVGRVFFSNAGSAYGIANIAASAAPPAIGLIVCLVCFQKAFSKPVEKSKGERDKDANPDSSADQKPQS